MKILLIDDDLSSLNTFQEVLILHGYDCSAFSNPSEGLDKYANDQYDLVILDYMMPDINGLEAARRIKSINPKAVIILYTGQADSKIEKSAEESGAENIFYKPIDWNLMLDRINEIKQRAIVA